MNNVSKKLFKKAGILLILVAFIFQSAFAGVLNFAAIAAPAASSELSFSQEANSFILKIRGEGEVAYALYYKTPEKIEKVSGNAEIKAGDEFVKEIYAGTCSQNDCVPHEVIRAVLKVSVKNANWLDAKRYVKKNGNFSLSDLSLVLEEEAESLELNKEETAFLNGEITGERLNTTLGSKLNYTLQGLVFGEDPLNPEAKWTTGNLCQGGDQDCYTEGDNVPFRLIMDKLEPEESNDETYSVNIQYDYINDQNEAFGYDGINREAPLPADLNATNLTFNIDPLNPTVDCGAGETCQNYIFSFQSTEKQAIIYWNTHLSDTASGWPGASLHVRLDSGSGQKEVPIFVPKADEGSDPAVIVTKFNDVDGNGFMRGADEEKLSNWIMRLENEDEGIFEEETTNENGEAIFEVPAGNYILSEEIQEGWEQTNIYCVNEVSTPIDPDNQHDVVVRDGATTLCYVGNIQTEIVEPEIPELVIAKSNNRWPQDLRPGDDVEYTIKIQAVNGRVLNVLAKDLLPQGFSYRQGSWKAVSNTRGELSIPEPTYASPGTWTLGNMAEDEIITLTYMADIADDQRLGLYKDVAWAEGAIGSDEPNDQKVRILATALPTGYVDENFVGTQVNLISDNQTTGSISVDAVKEEKREETKEVLGASTLPATGAETLWLVIALILAAAGISALIFASKMKKNLVVVLLTALLLASAMPKNALAANNLSIRLEQPKSPTNQDTFPLIFVVLDTSPAPQPITVSCYKKGPDNADFSKFGSDIAISAGGNTSNCPVDSSVINKEGTYQFYATASSNGVSVTSESEGIITVDYKTTGPGTPSEYRKEKSGCDYKISFKTSDDGGKTTQVRIYRSENTSFSTDDGTRVGIVNIGSNQNGSWQGAAPDCGKNYYFAIRAFDAAGNGSGVVGDSETHVTVTTITKTVSSGETAAPIVVSSGETYSETYSEEETEINEEKTQKEEKSEEKSEENKEKSEEKSEEILGAETKNTQKSKINWTLFGGLSILGLAAIFFGLKLFAKNK